MEWTTEAWTQGLNSPMWSANLVPIYSKINQEYITVHSITINYINFNYHSEWFTIVPALSLQHIASFAIFSKTSPGGSAAQVSPQSTSATSPSLGLVGLASPSAAPAAGSCKVDWNVNSDRWWCLNSWSTIHLLSSIDIHSESLKIR